MGAATHFFLITISIMLAGCAPFAITAAGLGGSAAMSHTMNGITYRTFTESSPRVKTATFTALSRMGIQIVSSGKFENTKTDVFKAKAVDRDIEIRLEPLSDNATRMRVTTRNGSIFYDSATSTEIILQTERVLARI
jgi:hypothetical protein